MTRATSRRVWLDATEYAVDVVDEGSLHFGTSASLAPGERRGRHHGALRAAS